MEIADDIMELASCYSIIVEQALHDAHDQGITDHFQLTLFVHAALMEYMTNVEHEAAKEAVFADVISYVEEVLHDTHFKGFVEGYEAGQEDARHDADATREHFAGIGERQ
jgi:hypothetical protein